MSDSERTTEQPSTGPSQGGRVVALRPGYGIPAPAAPGAPGVERPGDGDGGGRDGAPPPRGDDGRDGNGRPPTGAPPDEPTPHRVRIRKLRVLALFTGLGLLAIVSTVFGMMMAVASDLPALEEPAAVNSIIVDDKGRELGKLQGNERRIYLNEAQIAPVMKHAIIAIEDQRFYTNEGVDLRGIARALFQDVMHKSAVQGGSTITQQFVKNALAAQDRRTVFEKLREAALAYHLTRKWSKERILRNYLNTVYFGNGAYGIESAARTYFGVNHPGCDADRAPRPCAAQLTPGEAAMLAGIVQNPSAYDPIQHPRAARHRRDVVLLKMLQQGFLIRYQYDAAIREALPTRSSISPPHEDTRYPYFTSWIKQQVVDELGGGQEGARLAFEGGLRVKTTIDSKLQDAAQHAVDQWLPWKGGPRAALVAIDNRTGAVRAMVGGDDYNASPFNVATQGQRQPGSSIKPFIYARAIADGISPMSVWPSHRLVIPVPHSAEKFTVSNFEDAYAGSSTLINALTHSDNSVFAQVGLKVGTRRVARLMHRMGIRTPVSHNYAMTLGGLKQGVTPLDMAHAYSTLADHGRLTYGTLSPGAGNRPHQVAPGPVGIESITRLGADKPVELPGGEPAVNRRRTRKVLDPGVADTVATGMRSVVAAGTGTRAQITGYEVAGKTGTTENYGDAWFVGFAGNYTVAIWVGFPNKLKSMATDFNGGPVEGGTFPAAIFRSFLSGVLPPPKHPAPSTTVPAIPGTTTPVPQATPAAPIAPAVPTAAPPPAATATPAPTATPVPTAAPTTPTTPPAGTDGTTGAGGATGAGGTTPTG